LNTNGEVKNEENNTSYNSHDQLDTDDELLEGTNLYDHGKRRSQDIQKQEFTYGRKA